MKRYYLAALCFLGLLAMCQSTMAAILVDLQSTSDLSHLTVGQTVDFQVVLAGDYDLEYFAVHMQYDKTAFEASPLVAGSIIAESEGFWDASAPGFLDGSYDALFTTGGTTLTSHGPFYSFSLTVLEPGDSKVSLVHAEYADSVKGDFTVLTESELNASLSTSAFASATVPEPASFAIWGISSAAGSLILVRRRKLAGRRYGPAGHLQITTCYHSRVQVPRERSSGGAV